MTEANHPILEIRNLTCTIGGKRVLDDVSFTVHRGEIFGIMGMSGAGKSTLLRNIMGLLAPDSGEILIDGENICGLNETRMNTIRSKMGMCFQYAALFDSLTVYENVAFGLRRRGLPEDDIRPLVHEHLAIVGLEGTEKLMPASLSGGMRKRAGIARALITNPELILYDEPTSGLDPVLAASIDALIVKLRDEFRMTSLIVTHDVDHLFSYADRALMLYQAKAIACDTPTRLRASDNAVVRQFIHGSVVGPITV